MELKARIKQFFTLSLHCNLHPANSLSELFFPTGDFNYLPIVIAKIEVSLLFSVGGPRSRHSQDYFQ
jgi:hypothetical protein